MVKIDRLKGRHNVNQLLKRVGVESVVRAGECVCVA